MIHWKFRNPKVGCKTTLPLTEFYINNGKSSISEIHSIIREIPLLCFGKEVMSLTITRGHDNRIMIRIISNTALI